MTIEFDYCINRVMVNSQDLLGEIREENLLSAKLSNICDLATRLQQLNLAQRMLFDFYQLRGTLSQPISQLLYQTSKLSVAEVEGRVARECINQIILHAQYAHWYVDVLRSIWLQFSRVSKDEPHGRLSVESHLKWYLEHRMLQRRFELVKIEEKMPEIDGTDFQLQQLLKDIFSIALDLDEQAKLDLIAYQKNSKIWVHLTIRGQGGSLSTLLQSSVGQERYNYVAVGVNPPHPLAVYKLQDVHLSELSWYSAKQAVSYQNGQIIAQAERSNLNLIFALPTAQTPALSC